MKKSRVKATSLSLLMLLSCSVFGSDFPFVEVVNDSVSSPKNRVQIINSGMAALEKRLQMINSATTSISVESYIFNPNHKSVRLLLQAILEKAKKGVEVKLLADAGPGTWTLKTVHIDGLNKLCKESDSCKPIQLRFYNYIPFPSVYYASSLNFRNHRKMLLVDDSKGITGGRNLADEYFDLEHEYNFVDRDIFVDGPIVKTMRLAFDKYWKSTLTTKMEKLRFTDMVNAKEEDLDSGDYLAGPSFDDFQNIKKVYWKTKVKESAKELRENSSDKVLLSKVHKLGKNILKTQVEGGCEKITFASDRSGWKRSDRVIGEAEYTREDMDEARVLRKIILKHTENVNTRLIISSPYLITTDKSLEVMNGLLDRGVDVTLFGNSLHSGDGLQVSAMLYMKFPGWLDNGVKVHLHAGEFIANTDVVSDEVADSRWGTHSKTHLYDDSSFMIGSFNMDNRSSFYNTEAAIFCEGNKTLTAALEKNMKLRIDSGLQLKDKSTAIDKDGKVVSIYGNVNFYKIIRLQLWKVPSILMKPLL